jgi:hypothetical protein
MEDTEVNWGVSRSTYVHPDKAFAERKQGLSVLVCNLFLR